MYEDNKQAGKVGQFPNDTTRPTPPHPITEL